MGQSVPNHFAKYGWVRVVLAVVIYIVLQVSSAKANRPVADL